jgi:hypothetical protein
MIRAPRDRVRLAHGNNNTHNQVDREEDREQGKEDDQEGDEEGDEDGQAGNEEGNEDRIQDRHEGASCDCTSVIAREATGTQQLNRCHRDVEAGSS